MPKARQKPSRICRTCKQHHQECVCPAGLQEAVPAVLQQSYNLPWPGDHGQPLVSSGNMDPQLYPALHQAYEHAADVEAAHEENLPLIRALLGRHALVGCVHTAVMRTCTQEGMVLDVVVRDSSGQAALQGIAEERKYDALLRAHGKEPQGEAVPRYVLSSVPLTWKNLPPAISMLPMDLRIQSTISYVPPGSSFQVYVPAVDQELRLHAKMANRSSPVLAMPPFVHRELVFSSLESSSRVQSRAPVVRPRFLVIMDFEATCDFAPEPIITSSNSEIIEFPWVVLDTLTLEIVHEERVYVRPDKMEGITRYCQGLTGITKETCEGGSTLSQAVALFDAFVRSHLFPYGENNFRIVTDSVWDLQVQLRMEAKRKGIPLAWWYQEFFDVRQEFRQFYAWFPFLRRGPPLSVMIKAFGLKFFGRHHSGLDDCKSISQVVRVLLQLHPNTFTRPRVIPWDYDPMKDSSWCSFMGHCPPDAWLCSNEKCMVYNRPHMMECNFCNAARQ